MVFPKTGYIGVPDDLNLVVSGDKSKQLQLQKRHNYFLLSQTLKVNGGVHHQIRITAEKTCTQACERMKLFRADFLATSNAIPTCSKLDDGRVDGQTMAFSEVATMPTTSLFSGATSLDQMRY